MNAYDHWTAADWVQHYVATTGVRLRASAATGAGLLDDVTPNAVVDRKRRVEAKFKSLMTDAQACGALSPSELADIKSEYANWRRFFCENATGICATPPTPSVLTPFGNTNTMTRIEDTEQRIFEWQKKIQARCSLTMPVTAPPRHDNGVLGSGMGDIVKYGAVAIGLVAVAYMLGPVTRRLGG